MACQFVMMDAPLQFDRANERAVLAAVNCSHVGVSKRPVNLVGSVFTRVFLLTAFLISTTQSRAADDAESAAQRGFRFLTETTLIPPDFSDQIFNDVWTSWPEPLKSQAEAVSPTARREMAFQRYGLTTRPGDSSGKPLQYVVGANGGWSMNCFACHGGTVYSNAMPGSPNNRFALQSLTEETLATKLRQGKPPSRMDLGSIAIPLGTTNAVVFGMGLMDQRDEKLNWILSSPKLFTNHDMDAPPWWYFFKRPSMYIDGFAQKGHRGLMQFTLVPENGPDFYRRYEDDFRDVLAYITSLRPPKYTGTIDQELSETGRLLFNANCSECHGTYGEDWSYPNRRIPLSEIGTDPVRLKALQVSGRQKYARSWFAHAGESDEQKTIVDPDGYVAPPLDGVWASAPYFHNGSVPTLWHVLHPDNRPEVWHPVSNAMDTTRVGLSIEEVQQAPTSEPDIVIRRSYFDTRLFGKSRTGHDYPNRLTEEEKSAVLEYLKTL